MFQDDLCKIVLNFCTLHSVVNWDCMSTTKPTAYIPHFLVYVVAGSTCGFNSDPSIIRIIKVNVDCVEALMYIV